MQETIDLLALTLLPGFTPRGFGLLRQRGALAEVLAAPQGHTDVLSASACALISSGEARRRALRVQEECRARGIRILGLEEPAYPPQLRAIHDPPPVLYVRGELAGCRHARAVAVVGARAASPDGRVFARCLGRELAAAGVVVVSGLARGIDGEAHEGALEATGRTVAVLGSGVDNVYPPEHSELSERIARSGALVSEFRPGTAPYAAHFPRRNRVIAGWAWMVVVVEAGARSGALVTARLALDEGREVGAVPGHPSRENARGVNQLIRDGAVLVRSAQDVLEELGWEAGKDVAGKADPLLELLPPSGTCTFEELQRRSGCPAAELLARLSTLEIDQRVRRLAGALYARNGVGWPRTSSS